MLISSASAVVTGGSCGLGAAVTRMLVEAGGSVAVLDRQAPLETLERTTFIELDITDEDLVERAVNRAAERLGGLNLLVSCAGISPVSPVLDETQTMTHLGLFKRTVDINLIGLYDVVRHCARHFASNTPTDDGERGVIVNLASIAALEGPAGQTAYAASKGAVTALTLPLARDLAPWGIRVMAIAPGLMETRMITAAPTDRLERLRTLPVFPQRLGRPEELARLVREIVENTLLNGEVIRLDAATRLPANTLLEI
jgi:3-hydroxyacyl-CoA dehydrogenase/3-hydroxy-2-methylbutyryl-CoA dehydrogenase